MWLLDEELDAEGKAAKAVGVPISVMKMYQLILYINIQLRRTSGKKADRSTCLTQMIDDRSSVHLLVDQNHDSPRNQSWKRSRDVAISVFHLLSWLPSATGNKCQGNELIIADRTTFER